MSSVIGNQEGVEEDTLRAAREDMRRMAVERNPVVEVAEGQIVYRSP